MTFPDLPGCFAASDTLSGVVAASAEALALWFEEQPDAVPSDPETIDAEGGALVLVPYIRPTQDNVRADLSMPRHVLAAIDSESKARGLTRSAFIAHAALAEIEGRHR